MNIDVQDKDVGYLKRMALHPINMGAGAVTSLAATALMVASGPAMAVLPVIAYAVVAIPAATFLPGVSFVQRYFRRQARQERLDAERSRLEEAAYQWVEGARYYDSHRQYPTYWQWYQAANEAIIALDQMRRDGSITLSEGDLDHLYAATIDYLRCWSAIVSLEDRARSMSSKDIDRQIGALESTMSSTRSVVERQKLEQTISNLKEIRARKDDIGGRVELLKARMLAISDNIQEVQHRLTTSPGGGNLYLEEAIQKMKVEEELETAYEEVASLGVHHRG